MNIAFDIGGVISKYPDVLKKLMSKLMDTNCEIYIITDMHDKKHVNSILQTNGIYLPLDHIHCADYNKYGDMCKAILLRDLKIDLMFDDFIGYLGWDSTFGDAPIRLLVMPDSFKPYWHTDWKTNDDLEFGRRVYSESTNS